MGDDNIWTDTWDETDDWYGGGGEAKRLPRTDRLGATVYLLEPGNYDVYHFHHASDELLLVLDGEPTLRTPDGERRLARGDVVMFPAGPEGAHSLKNDTDRPARVVMVSTLQTPEVVEYPDIKKITAQAKTASQTGDRLWLIHDLETGDADETT